MMSDDTIVIGLMGDVMIGRGVNIAISDKGYLYPWGNVLSLLKNTDINIINLEAALTNSTKKILKTFNFKASPDKIKTLTEARITVANIANNDALEFSYEGLRETLQKVNVAGIKYACAGMNEKYATRPVITPSQNIKIWVSCFTHNEIGWNAGTSTR